MGILELIVGILLFLFLANLFVSLIPIPRGVSGTIVTLLLIILAWKLIF